ncbi:MAG TPA: L-histidine N(alpha)-methyltransferase [Eoetvoesiella sp.]
MSTLPEASLLDVTSSKLHRSSDAANDSIRIELEAGLLSNPATISPKYLYDALGSKLFEAICMLPEYYPTRIEANIFAAHRQHIAQAVGQGSTLIDLGAGNCAKAVQLFPSLHPKRYVPIDISADFLKEALAPLRQRFPAIEMMGLGLDFSTSLEMPKTLPEEKRVFFYPGSSIGNFSPCEALAFLRRVHAACGPDGAILLGVDLIKNDAILNTAYDDALGVTAAFNLNVLRNVNNLLNTDFDARDWVHRAFFNTTHKRIEMHLQARQRVTVRWPDGHRHFDRGDGIHTESSYKYTAQSFRTLLMQSGFGNIQTWSDADNWFAVMYARAD